MMIENVVLFIIGWLILTTFLFLFLVLRINYVEVKTSKNKLALKLAMHYSHNFHRLRVVFEKYTFHDLCKIEDLEGCNELYRNNRYKIMDSIRIISDAISLNCVDNQFVFVKNVLTREKLTMISKELIEGFQEWTGIINAIDDSASVEKFEQYRLKYDRMILLVIEMHSIIVNEVYSEILK